MNKEQIEETLVTHDDVTIVEMQQVLLNDDKLRENNLEYFELINREVERRQAQVNKIID